MGAPLYDITIYYNGNVIKDAPEDWDFRRTANYIADFYHDRLNGYKPTKTGRICIHLDSIKNWDKLSSEQKEKLQTKFVAEVNQQIGCKRAANSSFTFSRSSLTETREEIMETINNKKSHYGGSDRKPLKIVRINLHEY